MRIVEFIFYMLEGYDMIVLRILEYFGFSDVCSFVINI